MLAGRLVKTLAITGVSGHAILPAIITQTITQANCVHYSCPGRFVRGGDCRCCDRALNHRHPRRLLTWPHRDTATHGPPQFSSGSRSTAGSNWPTSSLAYSKQKMICDVPLDGIHGGSMIPPTPTTANATHISSCLSTSAHCCIKDSQGNFINLFVLFHRAT